MDTINEVGELLPVAIIVTIPESATHYRFRRKACTEFVELFMMDDFKWYMYDFDFNKWVSHGKEEPMLLSKIHKPQHG